MQATGRVLAEAVMAKCDVPSFANAAMDGFAVRAEDVTQARRRLHLVGAVTAGDVASAPLGPNAAVAIATGAPLPKGADAVCVIERASVQGEEVVLEGPISFGSNVRYPGEDIPVNSEVFGTSTKLGASHIGVLASVGVSEVSVYPSVRVGVLSTGSELSGVSKPLAHGQIYDSTRHALLAAVGAMGCEAINLGTVKDDPKAISEVVQLGSTHCDAIVTSGGVSVGVADHMKAVLSGLSDGSVSWMELAVRPAKPFGFAVLSPSKVPVLCMSGNPVSAMVSFELLARPAFRFMMGHEVLDRPAVLAIAEERMSRRRDGKVHFVRVVTRVDESGRLVVRPSGGQGSHQLRSMALANGLAILPNGEGAEAGDSVRVMIVDPDALEGGEVPM
jgi:molybdenum cofactor synthesis domain-containing protein